MNVHIPDVRVGEPTICGGVTVFPLFAGRPLPFGGNGDYAYALAGEAMADGTAVVWETSEVPALLVDNTGRLPVLFVEGEELKGGRQNRVVRRSVLAAAGSQRASRSSALNGNAGRTASGASSPASAAPRRCGMS